jgi:tetratricopeptide (TPR) repeat protein
MELLGRTVELTRMAEVVDTGGRRSATLLLLGDPGIGKSSLLRAAVRRGQDAGHRVLGIAGVEAEAELPFATLHQLLRPIQRSMPRLPSVQRDALNAAFGNTDGPAPEPFLIALAAVNLLTAAAAERPLLIVLDDVHWLDGPTHEAVAIIARRLDEQPIALIAAGRQGYPGPLFEIGLSTMVVSGLADGPAARLLRTHASELDPAVQTQILEQSRGNPLALVELPAAWPARGPYSPELPLTARLERAFAARVAQLSQPARDLLLVMAVAHRGDTAELLAATATLTGAPVGDDVVAEVTVARLVEPDPTGDHAIRFHHPLVRSGVAQAAGLVRRQAAHASLAAALDTDRYRRAWHRAMSIVGPDDEAADELAENAAVSLARGATSRAVAELERAAELSVDPARRGHRLLLAAQQAFSLGQASTVARLVEEASRNELDDLDWARVEWLREIFHDGIPGDAVRVLELCAVAHKAHAAGDLDLALNLLIGAGLRCWWADTGPATRTRCATAVKELCGADDDPRWVAALACAQPVVEASTVTEVLSRPCWNGETDGDRLRLLGIAAHAIGDTERAADLMNRAQTTLRDSGRLGLLPHVLGIYNHLLVELGQFAEAGIVVAEANRLAEETRQPVWTAGTLSTGGRLVAFQGDPDRAIEMAGQATRLAGRINDQLCTAVLAAGAAHLAAGRYQEAFEEHARIFNPDDPAYHWRESFAGISFMAESAVGAGRVVQARQILAGLEETARTTPAPLLHTHLGYARAVLAEDADAESFYSAALAMNLTHWPFVRARLELAYGEWLLRHDRTDEARPQLRAAAGTLHAIGAAPWARRASEALDATA